MKSRTFKPSRKVIIWSIVGVLAAMALGVFGWQFWQNDQHHQNVVKYKNSVASLLEGSKQNIEMFVALADTSKTAEAMNDLAGSLENQAKQSPYEPRLLGLQLGTNADALKAQNIVAGAKQYAKDLREAADFIKYQNSVLGTLMPLNAKTSSNLDQLNELVSAWTGASEAIKKISPPDKAKQVHVSFLTGMSGAVAALAKMPDLYKKVDTAGFAVAKKDLSAATGAINQLGVQYGEIAKTYDTTLAADRARLR